MAIIIDTTKCNGVTACPEGGLCIEICALNAMENVGDKPVVNEEVCPGCGLCVLNCPNEAISKT
ncbi:MAG: 4Fe-4S binding protein [Methanosphaera sp.]|nr:4Fe-4S binding protein [Methanosphaera sp.]